MRLEGAEKTGKCPSEGDEIVFQVDSVTGQRNEIHFNKSRKKQEVIKCVFGGSSEVEVVEI